MNFWVNLLKSLREPLFYSTTWIGVMAHKIFYFINWVHDQQHYWHHYMDWAQTMIQGSRLILSLLYSWKSVSPMKAHIYKKQHQSSWFKARDSSLWQIISFSTHDPSSWVSLRILWELWFGIPISMFRKAP